jgi:signal transduction histidine kinase
VGEVIDNLVDNAIKYTPEGATVTIEVKSRDSQGLLVVSDTGIGFSPEQKERLFDRFYRADAKEVQARHGSGLGLAIVQAITQVYGGSVVAHSDGLGRGSRFEVRLPLTSMKP